MSLLTIIQDVTRQLGLQIPNAVTTSTDAQILQLKAIADREGRDLAQRFNWQELIAEATFTTIAAESQGLVNTIAPGFKFILNETIWNRSGTEPIQGSISPQRWQAMKASNVTGPYPMFRIRGNTLRMIPVPAAGLNCAFEYQSKNWCSTADGVTTYDAWNADDNVGLLDERIMTLGIAWRFKKEKGFDYDEDFNTYERHVTEAANRNVPQRTLSMNGDRLFMGVRLAEGSWPTT